MRGKRYWPRTPTRCDICGRGGAEVKLIRASLVVSTTKQDGSSTTRSAGVIDFCELCWRDLKKQHRHPAPKPVALLPSAVTAA